MPNSDDTYGVFNKQTKIASQIDDGSTALTTFEDVAAAKTFYFTDDALAVWEETCTRLQWALVADGDGNNTKLKFTFAFGTKGAGTAEADDWGMQYNSRKTVLINNNTWMKLRLDGPEFSIDNSTDHIF